MATLTQIDRCTVAADSRRVFGAPAALNNIGAQTHIAYVKPTAVGGGNFAYLYGKTPSGSINGPRFFIDHNGGNPRLTFGVHSSTAGAPQRSSENNFVGYSAGWQYLSAAWDGSLNATGIAVYKRLDAESSSSAPASYATNVNGTVSVASDSANNAVIGNRDGGGRAFAGDRAWHAILSGSKTSAQIDAAIDGGILNHPDLIALFVNGDEIFNATISETSSTGITVVTDAGQFPLDTDLGGNVISITALPCEATGDALPVSLTIAGTVSVTPAPAEATGDALPVNLVVSGGVSIAALPAEATGEALPVSLSVASAAITLHADHDRASVNLSGSSVSGTGDSAIISIKPKVQESEVVSSTTRWLKPHVRVSGVNGIKPKFRFLDYKSGTGGFVAYPWPATRRPMYSYTGAEDDWFYFDNCALTDGAHAEFWNNTNFTSGEIYVCWNRAVRPKRFGQWLDGWQTAHPTRVFPTQPAIDYTPTANVSTWPAQWAIADEFSTQTDSLGATVPVTPLYSFAIRDDSVSSPLGQKAAVHFQMMTHAGEDMGLYIVKAMIEYLLAGAGDAPALLQYFDFTFSFNNMPGWVSGGWRGSWTQGTAGADDSNRHSHETTSGLEIVDKPKAVMQSILSGKTVVMFVDMHGDHTQKLWIFNTTTTDDTDFVNAINSFGLPTISLGGSTEGAGFWSTWANAYTGDSFTYEVGDPEPVPDADLTTAGVNLARAINKLRVDGDLNMPSGVIALTPAAAEASGYALPVSLTVTANVDAGVAEAAGEAMPVSLLVDIAPRPAAAEATGEALPVSLSIVESADFTAGPAEAIGDALPVSLRISGPASATGGGSRPKTSIRYREVGRSQIRTEAEVFAEIARDVFRGTKDAPAQVKTKARKAARQIEAAVETAEPDIRLARSIAATLPAIIAGVEFTPDPLLMRAALAAADTQRIAQVRLKQRQDAILALLLVA